MNIIDELRGGLRNRIHEQDEWRRVNPWLVSALGVTLFVAVAMTLVRLLG